VKKNALDTLSWYQDEEALSRGEPGIVHSYMASLATALNHTDGTIDPVWLMGSSAFAFRINVNVVMCPSAMSIFDFSAILQEAIEQAGHECVYVSRLWDEEDVEAERRDEAHAAIIEAIDRGAPAVIWDIHDTEWGLVVGYDEDARCYKTLSHTGTPASLPYDRLGRNGIDILSVAIPAAPNNRSRDEAVLRSLSTAVAHADGEEWTESPDYRNGLAGYDLWATLFDRWAVLVAARTGDRIPSDMPDFAAFYASQFYSARCYAREYLRAIANGDRRLKLASEYYADVATHLAPLWDSFPEEKNPTQELCRTLAAEIRKAKAAEEQAIDLLRDHLDSQTGARPG
jgi:hypothetical protein